VAGHRSVIADVLLGLKYGGYLAVVSSAAGVLAYVVSAGRAFDRLGISLSVGLGGYALAGLMSGVVWGLGRPVGRSWWGAALLGFLVAIPAAAVLASVVMPPGYGWRDAAAVALLVAVVAGPLAGIAVWSDSRKRG